MHVQTVPTNQLSGREKLVYLLLCVEEKEKKKGGGDKEWTEIYRGNVGKKMMPKLMRTEANKYLKLNESCA